MFVYKNETNLMQQLQRAAWGGTHEMCIKTLPAIRCTEVKIVIPAIRCTEAKIDRRTERQTASMPMPHIQTLGNTAHAFWYRRRDI